MRSRVTAAVLAVPAALTGVAALVAPAPARADVSVSGTVVGPDNKAVVGATVVASSYAGIAGYKLTSVSATTDAAGAFSVRLPDLPAAAGAPKPPGAPAPTVGWVNVFAPGFALVHQTLSPGNANNVTLAKAGSASGTVTDEKGKPVAGTTVRVSGMYPEADFRNGVNVPGALQEQFSTKTDANGRWTIGNVPATGRVFVLLDDPAYVQVRTLLPVGDQTGDAGQAADPNIGKPLVARPAAYLVGKVVFEDGKPAANVTVFCGDNSRRDGSGYNSAKTGADGTYKIPSLPGGTYQVGVTPPTPDVIAVAAKDVALKEAKTATVPDLVLGPGALIEGAVVDAKTGAPLEGAMINSSGPHSAAGPGSSQIIAGTDKQGRFRLRVAPGASQVYLWVAPPGYDTGRDSSHLNDQSVTLAKNETKTLEPFRLERTLVVSALVTDEAGKPLEGVALRIIQSNITYGDKPENKTDAQGKWSSLNQPPWQNIPRDNAKIDVPAAWEVVSPKQLKLPADLPANGGAPLRIVLRKANVLALRGRVVTPTGTPVAGAQVNVYAYTKDANGNSQNGRNENVQSGADGVYVTESLRRGETVLVSVSKPGYLYVRGGRAKEADGAFAADDAVLVPLSAKRAGRIVSAAGKPVAGAYVWSPEGGPNAYTTSDETGAFTLSELPEGNVSLMAAGGRAVGQARANEAGTTIVALAPGTTVAFPANSAAALAADKKRGVALLEKLAGEAPAGKGPRSGPWNRDLVAEAMVPASVERALALGVGEDGKLADVVLGGIITALTDDGRPEHADQAAALLTRRLPDMNSSYERFYRAYDVGMALADRRPQDARRFFAQARSEWGKTLPVDDHFAHFHLVALALRLRVPEANDLLANAVAQAKQADAESKDGGYDLVRGIPVLVGGDPQRAEAVANEITAPARRVQALAAIAEKLAPTSPAGALAVLNRAYEIKLSTQDVNQTEWSLGNARVVVLRAWGTRDADAALALARRGKNEYYQPVALARAARALAARPASAKEAAALWREAADAADQYGGRFLPEVAHLAGQTDPALGKTLRERAKTSLLREYVDSATVRSYAAFFGAADPALCRLAIERAFARFEIEAARRSAGDQMDGSTWQMGDLAFAMMAVDPDRALVLARRLPETGEVNNRATVERQIAEYLLAPPAKRAALLQAR